MKLKIQKTQHTEYQVKSKYSHNHKWCIYWNGHCLRKHKGKCK